MKSVLFSFVFCVMLYAGDAGALADELDDCRSACDQTVQPCVDQAKLTAGNIQEEQDMIAACQRSKFDCYGACEGGGVKPKEQPRPDQQEQQQPQQQEQQQPQQQEQQQEQQQPQQQSKPAGEPLNGTIKMYEFK